MFGVYRDYKITTAETKNSHDGLSAALPFRMLAGPRGSNSWRTHGSMPPSLHDAVASGDVAMATKIIDASLASNGGAHDSRNAAVMDRAGDIMGRTALHFAAEKGHVGMVEFLVGECQAEVNARDSQGARPMHYAAEGNKVEALDALLRNGAKVTMAVSVAPRHGLFPPREFHQWAPSRLLCSTIGPASD